MDLSQLSICIPAFNEEKAIYDTITKLQRVVKDAEIIVVDDCSTDNTFDILSQIKNIKLIRNSRNLGYGGSLKTAIRNSKKQFIAWYDADGQHIPEDLINVVAPIIKGEKDAVIGVRTNNSDIRYDRLPGKFILKIISERVVDSKIPDLNSGLRCFKRNIISKYLHLFPNGFSASTTSTLIMMKRGYNIGYVPITTKKRIGKSYVKHFKDGFNTLKLILRIFILFDALSFFSKLSFIQILPALIYGIHTAYNNKLGFPILAATIIISGLLTFFIGLLCDQIVALRLERFEDE